MNQSDYESLMRSIQGIVNSSVDTLQNAISEASRGTDLPSRVPPAVKEQPAKAETLRGTSQSEQAKTSVTSASARRDSSPPSSKRAQASSWQPTKWQSEANTDAERASKVLKARDTCISLVKWERKFNMEIQEITTAIHRFESSTSTHSKKVKEAFSSNLTAREKLIRRRMNGETVLPGQFQELALLVPLPTADPRDTPRGMSTPIPSFDMWKASADDLGSYLRSTYDIYRSALSGDTDDWTEDEDDLCLAMVRFQKFTAESNSLHISGKDWQTEMCARYGWDEYEKDLDWCIAATFKFFMTPRPPKKKGGGGPPKPPKRPRRPKVPGQQSKDRHRIAI